MNIKGIITGDIINSRKINIDLRDNLIKALESIINEINGIIKSDIEIFRGDSFQVIVDTPSEVLRVAILIRAGLKFRTPEKEVKMWDARISIGVGEVSYYANKIGQSDGEAFQLSGWGLDNIGKNKLSINTKWLNINDELKISTPFVDDLISKWTKEQAEVLFNSILYNKNQKETAEMVNKEYPNVSKLLKNSKEENVRNYINRFNKLVAENIK